MRFTELNDIRKMKLSKIDRHSHAAVRKPPFHPLVSPHRMFCLHRICAMDMGYYAFTWLWHRDSDGIRQVTIDE